MRRPGRSFGFALLLLLVIAALHPGPVLGQTFEHFLGMVPVAYDPANSCDDLPEQCGPGGPGEAKGLGLREIWLYWRGTYTDGARFRLVFPADWSIHELEFCDGITPVHVGEPGEPIELDFGECRLTEPLKLGRLVLNVRSRGYIWAEDEQVRLCDSPQFHQTIGHGAIELGLACDIPAIVACQFCGYSRMEMSPDRFEHILLAGNADADTLIAPRMQPCYMSGTCTQSITPCHGGPSSEVSWATLIDLGDPDHSRWRVEYGVQNLPPGRYRGTIRMESDGCCTADCLALDIQIITQVEGNRQPVARIRPLGEEVSPVQFHGTGSFDLDGSPLTYHWNFGDGSTSTDATPLHAFGAPGPALVTLQVFDGALYSTPDSLELVILPGPPAGIDDAHVQESQAPGMIIEAHNPLVPGEGVLSFKLSSASRVRVELFAVTGRFVGVLAEGDFPSGSHSVAWENAGRNQRQLQPGVYIVRITDALDRSVSRKIVVLD